MAENLLTIDPFFDDDSSETTDYVQDARNSLTRILTKKDATKLIFSQDVSQELKKLPFGNDVEYFDWCLSEHETLGLIYRNLVGEGANVCVAYTKGLDLLHLKQYGLQNVCKKAISNACLEAQSAGPVWCLAAYEADFNFLDSVKFSLLQEKEQQAGFDSITEYLDEANSSISREYIHAMRTCALKATQAFIESEMQGVVLWYKNLIQTLTSLDGITLAEPPVPVIVMVPNSYLQNNTFYQQSLAKMQKMGATSFGFIFDNLHDIETHLESLINLQNTLQVNVVCQVSASLTDFEETKALVKKISDVGIIAFRPGETMPSIQRSELVSAF